MYCFAAQAISPNPNLGPVRFKQLVLKSRLAKRTSLFKVDSRSKLDSRYDIGHTTAIPFTAGQCLHMPPLTLIGHAGVSCRILPTVVIL